VTDFSTAQFESVIDKINKGMAKVPQKLDKIIDKANDLLNNWLIPDPVKKAVKWAVEKLQSATKAVIDKIVEILKGVAAPVMMFGIASDWQHSIRAKATEVAGAVDVKALRAPLEWEGDGAERYKTAVGKQSSAAGQIGKIADSTATALTVSAGAGLLFYVAIGVIITKLLIILGGALIAVCTGAGAPAGLGAAITEVLTDATLITAAVTALVTALGLQAERMVTVRGEAQDATAFTGGHWPAGTAQ
jgi:uncharacterized protein YukE